MTFCVVEFSYFGLCKVLCRGGLRSSAVYLGDSRGEDKFGARDRILSLPYLKTVKFKNGALGVFNYGVFNYGHPQGHYRKLSAVALQ